MTLARAAANDRSYTADTYFETAAEFGGPASAAALRSFAETPPETGQAAVTALLQSAGIGVSFEAGEARLGPLPL